jgi:hypothetical protein
MIGSQSDFFSKPKEILSKSRNKLIAILDLKGYLPDEIAVYLRAFDYFCAHPLEFDGATIVKDLVDIPGLDIDSMLHDFHYGSYNVRSSFRLKWQADWLFAKGNERKGKGSYSSFSRFIALTLIGIVYIPYSRIRSGAVAPEYRELFLIDYTLLIKNRYRRKSAV